MIRFFNNFLGFVFFCFICSVIVLYSIREVCDRLPCFRRNDNDDSQQQQQEEEELDQRQIRSTHLTQQAGIPTISKTDRKRILTYFFKTRFTIYQCNNNDINDNNNGPKWQQQETTTTKITVVQGHQLTDSSGSGNNNKEESILRVNNICKEGSPNRVSDESIQCPICLSEYEDGDNIMTGTQCNHLFHHDCLMQWVKKGHDHCPYCRNNIMSPNEFLATAKTILGEDCVAQLLQMQQHQQQKTLPIHEHRQPLPRQNTTSTTNESSSSSTIDLSAFESNQNLTLTLTTVTETNETNLSNDNTIGTIPLDLENPY